MKSREEVIRLLWTLAGALVGAAIGFGIMAWLLNAYRFSPLAVTLIVITACGGGLAGGGYIALSLISRRQRIARKKYFDEKKKRKKKR